MLLACALLAAARALTTAPPAARVLSSRVPLPIWAARDRLSAEVASLREDAARHAAGTVGSVAVKTHMVKLRVKLRPAPAARSEAHVYTPKPANSAATRARLDRRGFHERRSGTC